MVGRICHSAIFYEARFFLRETHVARGQKTREVFGVLLFRRKRSFPTFLPQKVIVPDFFSHSVKELISQIIRPQTSQMST